MPDSRNPRTRKSVTTLDEAAAYLAELARLPPKEANKVTADSAAQMLGVGRLLRKRLSKKGGVPPQDTADLAQEVIIGFIAAIKRHPNDDDRVTGKYLSRIAQYKVADYVDLRANAPTHQEFDVNEIEKDSVFRDRCIRAHEDKQLVRILQQRAHDLLQREAARDKPLLGGQIERVVQVMYLVSANAETVDSALKDAADLSIQLGYLGGRQTRNLRVRMSRQAELRRELGNSEPLVIKVVKPETPPEK